MYVLHIKKFQNTPRDTSAKVKSNRSKPIGKRIRFAMKPDGRLYNRKFSRSGLPVEEGYEIPRIVVLHPTKGFRDIRLERGRG